jgi:glycosyltransferase involved in cell wall biosynthesis
MKLIYIFNSRMPIELAHGVQVTQTCGALARNNCEVELVVPRRVNPIKEDIFSYYGIKKNFLIKKIPCLDLIFLNGKNIFFWIQTMSFLFFCKIFLFFKRYDVVYTREQAVGLFFKNFILELHLLPKKIKPFHLFVWKRARSFVVLTPFIKEGLVKAGISPERIIIAPDAVDLEKFDINISKKDARDKLGLLQNKKLVGYVGMLRTLGMEKGVNTAIEAMNFLRQKDAVLVLVGGYESDINFYKDMAVKFGVEDRVIFIGRVSHSMIPIYLKAFDVLIAPFPENEHYSFYMSPMKIFEYMASKRPIVSTKLPSLQEILAGKGILVEPGDARKLATGINEIFDNPKMSEELAEKAYKEVSQKYTWGSRAKNILDEIKN